MVFRNQGLIKVLLPKNKQTKTQTKKTTIGYHYILISNQYPGLCKQKMLAEVDHQKPSLPTSRKWFGTFGREPAGLLYKKNIFLPFNPTINLLSFYPKELKMCLHKDMRYFFSFINYQKLGTK